MEVAAHLLILSCLLASFVTQGQALQCHKCATVEACKQLSNPSDCGTGFKACYMTITNKSVVLARGCQKDCSGGGGGAGREEGITTACCSVNGCNKEAPSLKCYTCAYHDDICETPIEYYCNYNEPYCFKVVQQTVDSLYVSLGCLNTCYEVSSDFYRSSCCKGELCNKASFGNGGVTVATRLLLTSLPLLAAMTNLVQN
ncbi:uncharacterized protein LOC144737962 [Lampetra planeri]